MMKTSFNLSFEFFCPVRLRESSRECKIGKGAILIKYSPLADLCIPEALTQPDRAKKLKTQVNKNLKDLNDLKDHKDHKDHKDKRPKGQRTLRTKRKACLS